MYSNVPGALAVALLLPVFWIHKTAAVKILFLIAIYYSFCYYVTHAYDATLYPLAHSFGIHLPSSHKIIGTVSAAIILVSLLWFYLCVYAHFTVEHDITDVRMRKLRLKARRR